MKIGIIGGSGLYDIEGFDNRQFTRVDTPFGPPSDEYATGTLDGRDVVFLPRHGRGHRILPSELNHRANIWGMKSLGVEWIISASAVGSLQAKFRPLDIVIPDQFFDRTKQSAGHTFFGRGIAAHIAFANPFCETLRKLAFAAAKEAFADAAKAKKRSPRRKKGESASSRRQPQAHFGGTYVNMEGPAFSTLAESQAHRKLGFDLIGMTNLGEAKCAREAEIHYVTLALVTDYDCWHPRHDAVTVEMIIAYLQQNAAAAKQIIKAIIPRIPTGPKLACNCHRALAHAIMTDKTLWPEQTKTNLGPILRKYLTR